MPLVKTFFFDILGIRGNVLVATFQTSPYLKLFRAVNVMSMILIHNAILKVIGE
jgi:hypothetical protein